MTEPLTWITKQVQIKDLKDYEYNPRSISKKDFELLIRSIKEDGYRTRILVDLDGVIVGGHSRKRALLAAGFSGGDTIEVLCPSRQLLPSEFQRINIRDNLSFGDYDFDVLSSHFDTTELLDWGFPEKLLGLGDDIDVASKDEDDTNSISVKLCKKCPLHKEQDE